jgi:hypothetical protein
MADGGSSTIRLRLFAVAALVAAVLTITTVVWSDWAEAIFGIDPDAGNGSFEAAVSLIFAVIAVVAGIASLVELTRARRLARR